MDASESNDVTGTVVARTREQAVIVQLITLVEDLTARHEVPLQVLGSGFAEIKRRYLPTLPDPGKPSCLCPEKSKGRHVNGCMGGYAVEEVKASGGWKHTTPEFKDSPVVSHRRVVCGCGWGMLYRVGEEDPLKLFAVHLYAPYKEEDKQVSTLHCNGCGAEFDLIRHRRRTVPCPDCRAEVAV